MKPRHIAKLSSRTWSFVLSLQYVKIIYTPCHRRGTNTHRPEPDPEPGSSYSQCLLGLHIMAQGMSTKFCICELLAKTGQPQISFWLFVPWLCCRCGMCAALSLSLDWLLSTGIYSCLCVCVCLWTICLLIIWNANDRSNVCWAKSKLQRYELMIANWPRNFSWISSVFCLPAARLCVGNRLH